MIPWAIIWLWFITYFEEMPLIILSGFLTIISSFTAGLVEGLIWRGYAIPKLIEKHHSVNVGVLISSITCVLPH